MVAQVEREASGYVDPLARGSPVRLAHVPVSARLGETAEPFTPADELSPSRRAAAPPNQRSACRRIARGGRDPLHPPRHPRKPTAARRRGPARRKHRRTHDPRASGSL
ncbi:hypothetical protein C5D44_01870 [Rathayibacter sp. AY1B5]|nr:hypothetical protein C5D44_01870 [Rathayibacter sp. AY1B5]